MRRINLKHTRGEDIISSYNESIFSKLLRSLTGIFLTYFIILSLSPAQAKTIWKIGLNDQSYEEFDFMSIPDQTIFTYLVPGDWNSIVNWKDFPYNLYPPELVQLPLEEIHITYNYQQAYRCPILHIQARSSQGNENLKLKVFKGENKQLIGEALLYQDFSPLGPFFLGPIQNGLHEENKIILTDL